MNLEDYLKQFNVIKTFKESGQKKVYLVNDKNDNLSVVKIGKVSNRHFLNRAIREVKIQQKLKSKYYPIIFDFCQFDDFNFCINEEYIESIPLSEKYNCFDSSYKVICLLNELTMALSVLWEKGLVHRDVKPDNILVKNNGDIVIIDLGIILAIDQTTLTAPFALSPLTPNYAAPEQLKNRKASIDFRTDQFSLGITVLQVINQGIHPFDPEILKNNDSIPQNILENKIFYGKLQDDEYKLLFPIINKMLGNEPYQRFKKYDQIINEVKVILRTF